MTELHAGLEIYRDQLQRAIEQQLTDQRRVRRRLGSRALPMGIAAGGAVAAAALAVTMSGGAPVQSADAAILRHVAAALTAPPATILHEQALVTAGGSTAPYELWAENAPPHHYHVLKWGHEGTGTTNGPYDFAAELRALVAAGQATVQGTTTINGVAAYKLSVAGSADRFLNGTAYVSRSDYYPLEIDTTANGGERIVFQTYEYLPATTANLRLIGAGTASTASAARK